MPQLDKVTFYLQTVSIIFAFLGFHFYAIRYIIRPIYSILKMRETCGWWFCFDKHLIDFWLGEHQCYQKYIAGISFAFVSGLKKYYIQNLRLNFISNSYLRARDSHYLKAKKYFDKKTILLLKLKQTSFLNNK